MAVKCLLGDAERPQSDVEKIWWATAVLSYII